MEGLSVQDSLAFLKPLVCLLDHLDETDLSVDQLVLSVDIVLHELVETDGVVAVEVTVLEDNLDDLYPVVLVNAVLLQKLIHFISVHQAISVLVESLKVPPQSEFFVVSLLLGLVHVHNFSCLKVFKAC